MSFLPNHQSPFGSAKEPKKDLAFLSSFPPSLPLSPPKLSSIVEMLLDGGGREDANDVSVCEEREGCEVEVDRVGSSVNKRASEKPPSLARMCLEMNSARILSYS